ncbi:MAG: GIY-YIG nuclease family protein [Candidatus Berkelbacteria bacterium]|nr:GIY-YIG nuclease family protein [Candidatus Berkelbacteria bacterium]
MNFYVYLLESLKDYRWYTGYTNNLQRRLKQHNAGYNFSTKSRLPFRLIYCEICLDEKDAVAREKYLKSGMGKRYLRNRLKNYIFERSNTL